MPPHARLIPRPSARVVLLDDTDRLLLFAARNEEDGSALEPTEKSAITGHRWWTVGELATTADLLRPAGPAQLLASLLTDGPPNRPIIVAG